ncbi:MAG: hypothetical protein ACRDNM_06190 [Gaiellaceae bacterium]
MDDAVRAYADAANEHVASATLLFVMGTEGSVSLAHEMLDEAGEALGKMIELMLGMLGKMIEAMPREQVRS